MKAWAYHQGRIDSMELTIKVTHIRLEQRTPKTKLWTKSIWTVDGNAKEDYLKPWIRHEHECQTSLIDQQVEEGWMDKHLGNYRIQWDLLPNRYIDQMDETDPKKHMQIYPHNMVLSEYKEPLPQIARSHNTTHSHIENLHCRKV